MKKTLRKTIKKTYRILSPEDYLINQRQSNLSKTTSHKTLSPLAKASSLKRPKRQHLRQNPPLRGPIRPRLTKPDKLQHNPTRSDAKPPRSRFSANFA